MRKSWRSIASVDCSRSGTRQSPDAPGSSELWRVPLQCVGSDMASTTVHLSLPTFLDLAFAQEVFDLVWRFNFAKPGYCVIDAGATIAPHVLRRSMVELKSRLSGVSQQRTGVPFCLRSMGRFDQQE